MNSQFKRFDIIDTFKGFAIIVVALYHFGPINFFNGEFLSFNNGVLPYGYLGVDIFFCYQRFFLS